MVSDANNDIQFGGSFADLSTVPVAYLVSLEKLMEVESILNTNLSKAGEAFTNLTLEVRWKRLLVGSSVTQNS